MKTVLATALLLCLASACSAQYYVYPTIGTSFSAAVSGPAGTSANLLYDDGLHGDGAAGDGVFGVDITVDQPAGMYYWNLEYASHDGSGYPGCWCTGPPVGFYRLWTTGPGDVIHFRLDTRNRGFWPIPGIACDHGKPVGAPAGMVARVGHYYPGAETETAATLNNGIWECIVTVPTAGTWYYSFATPGHTAAYGASYNGGCGGGCSWDEEPTLGYTTSADNTRLLMQFDEVAGQVRVTPLGATPAHAGSWGHLKSIYR